MARYKEQWASPIDSEVIGYFDTENLRSINLTPQNPFDKEFQEWLSEGNTPDPAYNQTEIDAYQAEVTRSEEIDNAQEATGLKHITVEEANIFIDSKLDAAETNAEVKEAIRDLFKKVAVFLLR